MSEMVSGNPLDQLYWLVKDKPTARDIEDLGGQFNPQFHFMALLPARALPQSEAAKVQSYFDAMFAALLPVRDLIAAYGLRGVMSRTPVSDFSLEVQFSDPYVVDMVRRSLPRELSGSAVAHQRRPENTAIIEAEGSMFFRDKARQEIPEPTSSDAAPVPEPAPIPASPIIENAIAESAIPPSAPAEAPLRVVSIAVPVPAAVLPEPVYLAPVTAALPAPEPKKRKTMLIAEGITIQGGDILGCAHLAIEGEAYSTVDRCDKLEILENGIFKGSASVVEAVISGYCTGTLVVQETLRITRTGHVVGSIQYGRLQVEDGGRIEGEMKLPLAGSETQAQKLTDNPRWAELNAKVSAA
jgi:cytoskeletal protein CcmA (bactofilin family)